MRGSGEASLYVGLMSGTSLDGVDAAVLEFDAQPEADAGTSQTRPAQTSLRQPFRLVATHFAPFPADLRAELLALHLPSHDELHRAQLVSVRLAKLYGEAVREVLKAANLEAAAIAAIGCHGQTVRHRPEAGYTLQLNAPALLAELTGISVVADFRSRDIAAGGQGAPLVPAFHAACFASATADRVILNIGGIANVTLLPKNLAASGASVTGFDTGPGNMLLDAWAERHLSKPHDEDGAWASDGNVNGALLDACLADGYFAQPAPKSTGRDHFNSAWLEARLAVLGSAQPQPEDVQATLAEVTAASIADDIVRHAPGATEVYACGGGVHNVDLMVRLARRLGSSVRLATTAALGLDPDWVEAAAFAWLAKQAVEGKPGNLPAVTGAKGLRVLGAVYPR